MLNVVLLGFTSLLTDVSSEMVYPLGPFFLTAALGARPAVLGLIAGVAESVASLLLLRGRHRPGRGRGPAGRAVSRGPGLLVALVLIGVGAAGCAGVPGVEVPYVQTPHEVVTAMLRLAGVGPGDVVYDLGSGDGRMVIAAARWFGARGVGVELAPKLVAAGILTVADVEGGTFTITNPGIFGGLFGAPIIHQPQVAILGVGAIEKRPVVRNDAIAIRAMVYLVLSFDHRIIDGAVADQFMARVKSLLENWDEPVM